jgi:4-hydroxy-2-oxoheptanedioate aldolase
VAASDQTPRPVNPLKARWRAGEATYGVLVTMPSVPMMQLLARAGFDWLIVDMEHGPIDIETAHAMIAATSGTPATPLLRVPHNLPWLAKTALDAGAFGIVYPMVNGRAEAETAVRAMKYPPEGERLWGPFYAPARFGLPMPRYVQTANDEVVTLALIEHPDAVRNIEEIVGVPGLDVAIVGIFDLAVSLGYPGQLDHPDVQAAVATVERAVLKSDVALGGVALSPAQARQMAERGYRALGLGFDWTLVQRGAAAVLEGLRP